MLKIRKSKKYTKRIMRVEACFSGEEKNILKEKFFLSIKNIFYWLQYAAF